MPSVLICKDKYDFSYEKVEKSGLHLATKIYNIYKNEVPISISDLNNDVLMEIFKNNPYFKHNKHHYIPRSILSNWQTNATKIPKNKKANSYIFNFKNGYIKNENFNIYERMQSIQYYTKIVYESGVEVMYTLEGGFINNISEFHILDILNNNTDKNFFSNTSINNNDFYTILSAIYYINNRGTEAFFHDIFNLIINSNNFIKEYKKLLVKKFYEFYKKSIFKNKKFSVYVMNFEENFLFMNDFWGVLYGYSRNYDINYFTHIIPLKQNKAIVISNLDNIKDDILINKISIQELIIRDSMYLSQKLMIETNILVGENDNIIDNYLNKGCQQNKIYLGTIKEESSKYIINKFELTNKYRFGTIRKNYLNNPDELSKNSKLDLVYTYRGLFENKIINQELKNNSIEINTFYEDKFNKVLEIFNCFKNN